MRRLRLRFVERARGQLADLKQFADAAGAAIPENHADLVPIAHSLAGASGIFGFPGLGDCASELETALIAPEETSPAAIRHLLARLIAELEAAVA